MIVLIYFKNGILLLNLLISSVAALDIYSSPLNQRNDKACLPKLSLEQQLKWAHENPENFFAKYYINPPDPHQGFTIGIVGDSVPAGSVTDSNYNVSLSGIVTQSLLRLGYDLIEFKKYFQSEHYHFVNVPDFSFAQIIARMLNVGQEKIINTSYLGAKIESLSEQFDQLYTVMDQRFQERSLPRVIFVSYTANNMCSVDFEKFRVHGNTYFENYYDELKKAYEKILKLPANKYTSDIFVLANLNVMNLLTNKSVLNRPVELNGKNVTCQKFRNPFAGKYIETQQDTNKILVEMFLSKLFGLCGAILSTPIDESGIERRVILKEIYDSYLYAHQKAIEDYKDNMAQKGIYLRFVPQTSTITFEGTDIANDCFHPNFFGQLKIAKAVLESDLSYFHQLKELNESFYSPSE